MFRPLHFANRVRLGIAALLCICSSPAFTAVTFAPCELVGSSGYTRAAALCGSFRVPENPADPEGPQIDLFVAKIESLSPSPQTDAFTIINGGPGGSSISLYVDLAAALNGLLPERDIIIVDQRGTGRSQPLTCPNLEDVSETYNEAAVAEATRQCLASLPGDPKYYSTSQAVRDLEALREALGYQKLNIYGVSYGTRVALHYLRQHPNRVRSMIIDGVVPPDLALGVNVAQNAQTALNATFARCAATPRCAATFTALEESLAGLRLELGDQTIPVQLPHPLTGAPTTLEFSYQHLAISLRLLSYAPETAALIPLIIDQSARGNYIPAASMALKFLDQLAGSLSYGMHNAVVCTEDLPFIDEPAIDWQHLETTYLGADQVRALITICNNWPRAAMDKDFKQPVESDTPVLILSGENDPVTPPAYGARVAQRLSNSIHIQGRGQGHGIISRGCIPRLVAEFTSTPDPSLLDTSCTARLTHYPFFLSLLGPAP
jgi:pimeloyl-ACP methyl ester carboxylesterase